MSVIFKTLKKLRSQSLEGSEDSDDLKKRRNVYSFRNIFSSPQTAILLILFIFLSGLVSIYAINSIKEKLSKAHPLQVESERHAEVRSEEGTEALTKNKVTPEEPDSFIPPPPEHIPVEEIETGVVYIPDRLNSGKIPAIRHPATAGEDAGTKIETKEAALKERTALLVPPAPDSSPAKETKEEKLYYPNRITSKNIQTTRDARYTAPRDIDTGPVSPQANNPPIPSVEQSSSPVKETASEVIHRLRVHKTTRIGSLIKTIQKSMRIDSSNAQTDALLDQLTLLKGENDCYVLKLRAFCFMNRGDYDSAASLLNRVLQENENDLEAGINMAIIEIKKGQLNKAKSRLYRLRDIHPHDTQIPELIYKLE